MSRATEKAFRELYKFIDKKAPQGVKSDEEMEKLINEFMTQYNDNISNAEEPQDAYDYLELAEQAGRKQDKRKYLAKAAALEPENADVKLAQVELDAKGQMDLIIALPALISDEEKRLKEQKIYNSSKGDFWGVLETRPYMRLKYRYMMSLAECGVINKAIQVGEEMMRLNRSDNLGIRFMLMAFYAKSCNEMKALKLYRQTQGAGKNPFYLLPLALLYFKLGEWPKAKSYINILKDTCPDTKKFFRAVKKDDEAFFHEHYNPMGYCRGSVEELIAAYLDNYAVYRDESYFLDWADEALIVHRNPKK